MSTRATIHLPETVLRIVGKTDPGELSGRIADIVDRYGEIIRRTEKEIESVFTEEDIILIATIIQGAKWKPASTIDGGILEDLKYARTERSEGRQINKALLDKIKSLSYAQQVALIEIVRKMGRQG